MDKEAHIVIAAIVLEVASILMCIHYELYAVALLLGLKTVCNTYVAMLTYMQIKNDKRIK